MNPLPVLGFCGFGSNVGKTTLLTRIIPALIRRGIRVAAIKHAHHGFDIDHPGKDSHRLRESGATQVMVASAQRWALITEKDDAAAEPDLHDLLGRMDPALADLVLVEGFRHEAFPRVEIHRPTLGHPLLAQDDPHIIAIATDGAVDTRLPVLDLNDSDAIARFVVSWLDKTSTRQD